MTMLTVIVDCVIAVILFLEVDYDDDIGLCFNDNEDKFKSSPPHQSA